MGHFESGGTHYDGPAAVRALEVDLLPVIAVAGVLGNDEHFRELAAEVAGDQEHAHEAALAYVRSGSGRRAIAAMLVRAGDAPPNVLRTRLMNMGRRACFSEAPLVEGDARNRLRVGTVDRLVRGAELVARRGAGRCLACGCPLRASREGGSRREYCYSHEAETGHKQRAAADKHEMRELLRAVAEHLGVDTDGPRARRARRSGIR